MALVEEAADVGAFVSVKRLDAGSRKAHDDKVIGDVGEIEVEVETGVLEAGLLTAHDAACDGGHLVRGRKEVTSGVYGYAVQRSR